MQVESNKGKYSSSAESPCIAKQYTITWKQLSGYHKSHNKGTPPLLSLHGHIVTNQIVMCPPVLVSTWRDQSY